MKNTLKVNAWLERSDPCIELRNTQTGKIVLSIQGNILHEIVAMGSISYDELYSEKHILKNIFEELFSSNVSEVLGTNLSTKERRKKSEAEVVRYPCKTISGENDNLGRVNKLQLGMH
jgi:hypothetical protein